MTKGNGVELSMNVNSSFIPLLKPIKDFKVKVFYFVNKLKTTKDYCYSFLVCLWLLYFHDIMTYILLNHTDYQFNELLKIVVNKSS